MDAGEQGFGGGVELLADVVAEVRSRAFLNHFLVAALAGAVAFAQSDGHALAVTKHLHFDMTGAGDEFFQKDAVVGEVVGPEAFDTVESGAQFVVVVAQLHADATTTRGGF